MVVLVFEVEDEEVAVLVSRMKKKKKEEEEEKGGTRVVDSVVSCCVCPLAVHRGEREAGIVTQQVCVSNVTVKEIRAVLWWKRLGFVTYVHVMGRKDGARTWRTRFEAFSDTDDSHSPDFRRRTEDVAR